MQQNNQNTQVNAQEVINDLASQIAQLSADNAILRSQLNQVLQQQNTKEVEE